MPLLAEIFETSRGFKISLPINQKFLSVPELVNGQRPMLNVNC
jgi:hypothetical protein